VGKQEGAKLLIGGGRAQLPGDLSGGYYIQPTLFKGDNSMRIFREEIFGPVLAVTTFKNEAEALQIANDTQYGLGAGLWTRDVKRAHRVAKAVKSGMVWVNCYKRVHPASPFGGVGESGYGREMGFEVMREYTHARSVWINVDAKLPAFYPR